MPPKETPRLIRISWDLTRLKQTDLAMLVIPILQFLILLLTQILSPIKTFKNLQPFSLLNFDSTLLKPLRQLLLDLHLMLKMNKSNLLQGGDLHPFIGLTYTSKSYCCLGQVFSVHIHTSYQILREWISTYNG